MSNRKPFNAAKLISICENVNSQFSLLIDSTVYLKTYNGDKLIRDIWDRSLKYKHMQTQMINGGDLYGVLKILKTGRERDIAIRARKNYNEIQWFVLLYMEQWFARAEDIKDGAELYRTEQELGEI